MTGALGTGGVRGARADAHSVSQGVWTPERGGVEAGVVDRLVETLDLASPTWRGWLLSIGPDS